MFSTPALPRPARPAIAKLCQQARLHFNAAVPGTKISNLCPTNNIYYRAAQRVHELTCSKADTLDPTLHGTRLAKTLLSYFQCPFCPSTHGLSILSHVSACIRHIQILSYCTRAGWQFRSTALIASATLQAKTIELPVKCHLKLHWTRSNRRHQATARTHIFITTQQNASYIWNNKSSPRNGLTRSTKKVSSQTSLVAQAASSKSLRCHSVMYSCTPRSWV